MALEKEVACRQAKKTLLLEADQPFEIRSLAGLQKSFIRHIRMLLGEGQMAWKEALSRWASRWRAVFQL